MISGKLLPRKNLNRLFMDQSKSIVLDKNVRQGFVEEGFYHRIIAQRVHVGVVVRIYVRNSIIQAGWIYGDCLLGSGIERNATSASFVKERGSWLACRILFGAGANA